MTAVAVVRDKVRHRKPYKARALARARDVRNRETLELVDKLKGNG